MGLRKQADPYHDARAEIEQRGSTSGLYWRPRKTARRALRESDEENLCIYMNDAAH